MPVTVVQTSTAAALAAELQAVPARVEAGLPRVVDSAAVDLLAAIQRNASGHPGPEAPTGEYRATWTIDHDGSTTAAVGTSAVQAHRLEYGFVGADALGRVYHQPPFPHMEPAALAEEPRFEAAVGALLETVL